jgi:hypothetical protein
MALVDRLTGLAITILLFIIPLMTTLDALVKYTHGLIGTSNLHLQEECFFMIAGWTGCHCSIDMLPSLCTTQNVVNFLSLRKGRFRPSLDNGRRIGAGATEKFVATTRCLSRTNLQERSIHWTKPHDSWLFTRLLLRYNGPPRGAL